MVFEVIYYFFISAGIKKKIGFSVIMDEIGTLYDIDFYNTYLCR